MSGATRADVVIVGGGLLGLATAYALRGAREVIVFEQDTIGHGRGGSPRGQSAAIADHRHRRVRYDAGVVAPGRATFAGHLVITE